MPSPETDLPKSPHSAHIAHRRHTLKDPTMLPVSSQHAVQMPSSGFVFGHVQTDRHSALCDGTT